MTALALPRQGLWVPPKLRLDRFDFRRILRPLESVTGQFSPYQPLQFEDDGNPPGYGLAPDITVTDDGDASSVLGTPNPTHTISSQTSTGPVSVLCISREEGAAGTLSTVTWGGNSMTILVQAVIVGQRNGAAIAIINGAQSGSIVLTFTANVKEVGITKLSLTGVQSLTPVDTDTATTTTGTNPISLNSLNSPGVGGVRIAVASHSATGAETWTNATEASDVTVGAHQHLVAYDLGDDGTTISVSTGGTDTAMVGVSLR